MQKRVLIVEDDNDILELLKLYLESSNFLVYVAYVLYTQQTKLDSYAKDKQYYEDQIADLNEQKEELIVEKEKMLITQVNYSTKRLIVTRGYDNTTITNHNSSIKVTSSIENTVLSNGKSSMT